jgi:hypothetical protein
MDRILIGFGLVEYRRMRFLLGKQSCKQIDAFLL